MIKKTKDAQDSVEIGHDAKPSWKRYGNGYARLRLRNCIGGKKQTRKGFEPFIELSIEEASHPEDDNGRFVSRYTYFGAVREERDAIIDVVAPGYKEMLEALRKIENNANTRRWNTESDADKQAWDDVYAQARAAIAKAEVR